MLTGLKQSLQHDIITKGFKNCFGSAEGGSVDVGVMLGACTFFKELAPEDVELAKYEADRLVDVVLVKGTLTDDDRSALPVTPEMERDREKGKRLLDRADRSIPSMRACLLWHKATHEGLGKKNKMKKKTPMEQAAAKAAKEKKQTERRAAEEKKEKKRVEVARKKPTRRGWQRQRS